MSTEPMLVVDGDPGPPVEKSPESAFLFGTGSIGRSAYADTIGIARKATEKKVKRHFIAVTIWLEETLIIDDPGEIQHGIRERDFRMPSFSVAQCD